MLNITKDNTRKALFIFTDVLAVLSIDEKIQIPNSILELDLISSVEKNIRISDELDKLPRGGILILDFWASWCQPCIAEFSSLKKQKDEFSNLPVSFVPINLDNDRDNAKWQKVASEHKYLFSSKDYRISDVNRKILNGFFKIKSIPRYVAIDKGGRVIDFNLLRPSEDQFKTELLNYLQQSKKRI